MTEAWDLNGRIELFGVANVFQFMQLAQATGKLVLIGDSHRARVYFHEGNLIYARTDATTERLGDYLVRAGVLEQAQLDRLDLQAELSTGRRIGSILVDRGILTEEQLKTAVRNQIKEVVFRLMRLDEGIFAFHSNIYPKNEDILLDVSLDYLMLEGVRKMDELGEESLAE
jgi:hypothetical protein